MALIKTQKVAQREREIAEKKLAVLREYARLWQEYFKYFSDRIEGKRITEGEENAFAQLMNVLALNQFRFVETAYPYFKDPDSILKVLTETVSLSHLQQMSDAQFSKLQIDWHTIFIAMNKAIGKFIASMPPAPESAKQ